MQQGPKPYLILKKHGYYLTKNKSFSIEDGFAILYIILLGFIII